MSIIKSISVGHGDMFYIYHNSDNFTIIDCNLIADDKIIRINELKSLAKLKGNTRFISTSPDLDHIRGIKKLDEEMGINNFYVVKNNAQKNSENEDFQKYRELHDSTKSFYISKGVSRKWMNIGDDVRGSSGISILWPILNNDFFKAALENAENGNSPNNISPIFRYALNDGATVIWMGDLETPFMDSIIQDITIPPTDILIAPHHGRKSGKVSQKFLDEINPKVIIVGEASSDDIDYYAGYNTITQNRAQDITMECIEGKVHFYSSNTSYSVKFLKDEKIENLSLGSYIGTLNLQKT